MAKTKVPLVTIDQAIELLNEANRRDPEAISAIMGFRFPCNKKLANHKTIQVGKTGNDVSKELRIPYTIGSLGLINGIFGVSSKKKGWGYICAEVDTETGAIVRFIRTPGTL